MKALVIPVAGPVYEVEVGLPGAGDLRTLQEAVGGTIEALPLPRFLDPAGRATAYVHDEGKWACVNEDGSVAVNYRATDFMVPGVGLSFGDFIAGPFVLCGFNPADGEHDELPQAVIDRARLIESEAG